MKLHKVVRKYIRYYWRRLLGRCVVCGGKRTCNPNDYYSQYKELCRSCYKFLKHAESYGGGGLFWKNNR